MLCQTVYLQCFEWFVWSEWFCLSERVTNFNLNHPFSPISFQNPYPREPYSLSPVALPIRAEIFRTSCASAWIIDSCASD